MAKFDDDNEEVVITKKYVQGGNLNEEYQAFASDHEEPRFDVSLLLDESFPANCVYIAKGGKPALPAWARIAWFRNDHPDYQIVTDVQLLSDGENPATVAFAYTKVANELGFVLATGTKTWSKFKPGSGAFFVECAETGSVARALEYLGYSAERAKLKQKSK